MDVFKLANKQKDFDDYAGFEELFLDMFGVEPEYDADQTYYPKVGGIEWDVYRIGNRKRLRARVAPGGFIDVLQPSDIEFLRSDGYVAMIVEEEELDKKRKEKTKDKRDEVRERLGLV